MTDERVAAGPSVGRPPSPARSWLRLALPVAGCVLLISATAHVRVPLLPELGTALAMPASQLGVAVTLFGLGRLAMDLPAGSFADRFRPLHVMGAAAVVMSLGSAALALATDAAMVMAAFLLLGAASATANTTGMTSLTGAAPAERRGSAMALYSGCLLTGQALGPALSGVVAGLADWRLAAASGAFLGGAVAVVAFSWRSAAALSAGRSGRRTPTCGPPLTSLQRRVAYGIGFCVFLTVGAVVQTLVPLIGAAELDLDVSLIGLALGCGGVARVVSAVATGAVSDAVSRRAALIPCLVLQLVGVSLLAADGAAWWMAAVVLLSLGASAHAVAATMLVDRGEPSMLGRSLGRYRFVADLGLVVGPVVTAFLYEGLGRVVATGVIAGTLLAGTVAAVLLLPETGVPKPAKAARAGGSVR